MAATMLEVQTEALSLINAKQLRNFHVRVPRFDLAPVPPPASWRATPDRLSAIIALASTDDGSDLGRARWLAFSKFGVAQRKQIADPLKPIAIPTENIRPSPMDRVAQKYYAPEVIDPKRGQQLTKLSFKKTKGGIQVTKKLVGEYFVLGRDGQRAYGAWERFGTGRRDIRMLWHYVSSEPVAKRLDFEADVRALIANRYPIVAAETFKRIVGW